MDSELVAQRHRLTQPSPARWRLVVHCRYDRIRAGFPDLDAVVDSETFVLPRWLPGPRGVACPFRVGGRFSLLVLSPGRPGDSKLMRVVRRSTNGFAIYDAVISDWG